ncbi:MAG TPA: hypothetical protein VKU41_26475 [Polyangiaceae bacterium]|nr:hypothetical protein [Polyangiaceae bacterium]
MKPKIVAVPTWIGALLGFGACGGQVVVGGAKPSDGGSPEAATTELDAASATPADLGDASAPAGPTTPVRTDLLPIMPGQEITACQTFSNPFGRDVDVVSIQVTTDAHDVFLFSLPPSGAPAPSTGLVGCQVDPLGTMPILYFSDKAASGITYPQPNMGYPLAAANSLMLRVHYVNAANAVLQAQTIASLGVAAPGMVTTHVGAIFLRADGFPVAAPFVQQSFAMPLTDAFSIFLSWSFASPTNATVRATASGTALHDVTNRQTYSQLLSNDPPVMVGAGQSIQWSCEYPSADSAQSGNCVYQGFYYPADPTNPNVVVRYSSPTDGG